MMLKLQITQKLVGIQSVSFATSLFSRSHLGKRSQKVVLTASHGAQHPGPSLQQPQKAVCRFPIPRPSSPTQQQYLFGSNVTNRCVCLNETSTIQSRLKVGSYISQFIHGEKCFYSVSFQWTQENDHTLVMTKSLNFWVLLEIKLNKELLPVDMFLTFYFVSLYHTYIKLLY